MAGSHPSVGVVLAALVLLAGCGNGDWRYEEIALVEVDGDRLVVGSHCHEAARAAVEETSSRVEVTFEVQGDPRGDCYDTVEIELDRALGDRAIIDASTGDPADRDPPMTPGSQQPRPVPPSLRLPDPSEETLAYQSAGA